MSIISTEQVKSILSSSINSLLEQRELFIVNPNSDFTRAKKITFEQAMLFPLVAASGDVSSELLDFFGEDNLPSASSMIQRRNQIKPEAFIELFKRFTNNVPLNKSFNGYQLVACDGSRINLPYNPSDEDSFIKCIKDRKGINQVHLNALYDVLNDIFIDAELQSVHHMDEKRAFCGFLDKYASADNKRIYIADRGYVSYNVLAHLIHNQQLFLIRMSDTFANNLCVGDKKWLTDECVDKEITINIGRHKTKRFGSLENYHCLASRRTYDYLSPKSNDIDTLKLRVLKFPISENSYEYIVTNLPMYMFSLETIKDLYHLRWNEETAFRFLKYAGNLVHIHSLKRAFLIQEIYAKLVLYNFSTFITSVVEDVEKKTAKYHYVKNHSQAQKICLRFLRGSIKDVKRLISKCLVPVRLGRSFARNLRRQSADSLTYR
jgi:hypothetical protein